MKWRTHWIWGYEVEERLSDCGDRNSERIQLEKGRKQIYFLKWKNPMNLKNVNRKANIRVNVILAGDEEEKGQGIYLKNNSWGNFKPGEQIGHTSPPSL